MTWAAAWPSQTLQQSRQRLVDLRETAENLPRDTNDEMTSAISRFLIVRSAGHIEFTFDECIHSFAISRSSPEIASYVRAGLFNGRNPSPGNLVSHLQRLSPTLSIMLSSKLDENDEEIKRALAFLVERRNQIAHGQSENVRLRKSLDLCAMSLELTDWIIQTIDPR